MVSIEVFNADTGEVRVLRFNDETLLRRLVGRRKWFKKAKGDELLVKNIQFRGESCR